MLRMTNAASAQAVEVFKERLREFLETSETGRQAAVAMGAGGRVGSARADADNISLKTLDSNGREKGDFESEAEDDV